MATGQTTESQTEKGKAKSRWRWIMIGGLVVLLGGVAAGAGIWRMQNPTPPQGKTVTANLADEGQALLPLGRMTVNVAAAAALTDRRNRYLVIEPTLLYAANFDSREGEDKMETYQAALRDSFIEFLSQLHENDVYGSAGLAELRSELLRRARLVTQSDAPISILLQDFVLQ